jgi:hypothetical protein
MTYRTSGEVSAKGRMERFIMVNTDLHVTYQPELIMCIMNAE